MSILLFEVFKLYRKNTQPESMRDIVYEKTNGRGRRLKRVSVYAEASVRKKSVTANSAEFTRKYLCWNLLF